MAEKEEWDEWKANNDKKLADAREHFERCWNKDIKEIKERNE